MVVLPKKNELQILVAYNERFIYGPRYTSNTKGQENFPHCRHSRTQTKEAATFLNTVNCHPTGNRVLESLTPATRCSCFKLTRNMFTHNLSEAVIGSRPALMVRKYNQTKSLEDRHMGIFVDQHTDFPNL